MPRAALVTLALLPILATAKIVAVLLGLAAVAVAKEGDVVVEVAESALAAAGLLRARRRGGRARGRCAGFVLLCILALPVAGELDREDAADELVPGAVATLEGFDVRFLEHDVDLLALEQMGRERFGALPPHGCLDPLRRAFAVVALAAVVEGQREVGDGFVAGGVAQLGVFSDAGESGENHCVAS